MSAFCSRPPVVCIRIDEDQRRMMVAIEGEAGGRQSALCEVFQRRPEVSGFDYLFDLQGYRGDVAAGDLEPVAELYASVRGEDATRTRTAFITPDPLFGLWATAMNFQFPGRDHAAFSEAEEAERFLTESKASRPAPATGF